MEEKELQLSVCPNAANTFQEDEEYTISFHECKTEICITSKYGSGSHLCVVRKDDMRTGVASLHRFITICA
jgi:hypothetical protein